LQKSLDAAVQAYHQDGSEDALARICEIQGLLARSSQIPIAEPHGAEPGD
jgi:DNA primase